MRGRLYIIVLLLLFGQIYAQQEPMYSQYMWNGLAINPAYAGSHEALNTILHVRKQWTGMEGSPSTYTFTAHAPAKNQRSGWGTMVRKDEVAFISNLNIDLNYAYIIPLKSSKLSLGLLGGVANYRVPLSSLRVHDAGDPVFASGDINLWRPKFGSGIYWYGERFYLGASVPNLFGTGAREMDRYTPNHFPRKIHAFSTGGYVFQPMEMLKVKPSYRVRYTDAAPLQADVNLNVYWNDLIGAGVSARSSRNLVFMAQIQLTRMLHAGYAYDHYFGELNVPASSTHEFMIGVDFSFRRDNMTSPTLITF